MDRVLAKKTKDILFVKVENDGFDLGAQRRPIDKNDLPQAAEILKRYKTSIQTGNPFELSDEERQLASLIPIEKISQSGDYNLSSDRYKETKVLFNQKWPMVELGDVCTFEYGKPLKEENRKGGEYPVFGSNGIVGYHDEYLVNGPFIIVGRKGTAGAVVYSEKSGYPIDTTFYIKINSVDNIEVKFLYYILGTLGLDKINTQAGVPGLNRNDACKIKFPLPPLEVQQKIVTQLDSYQKIIDGAKQVVDNYKPEIKIDPNWDFMELGNIVNFNTGKLNSNASIADGKYPFFTCSKEPYKINSFSFDCEALMLSGNNASGDYDVKYYKGKFDAYQRTYVITIKNLNLLDYQFLKHQLNSKLIEMKNKSLGGLTKYLTLTTLNAIKIPLPPLDIQKQIVTRIEEEQQIVDANKKLIELYQGKIKEKIDEVWGE
jgi:type I restriction enzyme M protein